MNAALLDAQGKIRNGAIDIDAIIDTNDADSIQSVPDKIKFAEKTKTFFSTWHSAFDPKIVTSTSTIIAAGKIEDRVAQGIITRDVGLNEYIALTKQEGIKIENTDNKQFINNIFSAGEKAETATNRQQSAILSSRTKQLRDAIEKQPNFLAPEEADEILKDFANTAVIELSDKFREGEFDEKDIQTETDRLIIKYTLSSGQLARAELARELRVAESLKKQQELLKATIESLRSEGNRSEAKEILDEAVTLGIFSLDAEGNITEVKSEKKEKRGLGKKLLERLFGL